jgi:hypothetical protein
MNRKDKIREITKRYQPEHQTLEDEFFVIVDKGKRTQHRELREGKTRKDFDDKHTNLWRGCNAEIAELPPDRDPLAEIDELKRVIRELEDGMLARS